MPQISKSRRALSHFSPDHDLEHRPRDMQTFKTCTRQLRTRRFTLSARHSLSTAPPPQQHLAASSRPWFVDPTEEASRLPSWKKRQGLSHRKALPLPPLPSAISEDSPIGKLHAALASSPHLEPGTLLVREPIPTAVGPPLPLVVPRGRRKRGRTYGGEGIPDPGVGIWNWVVIAQVRLHRFAKNTRLT